MAAPHATTLHRRMEAQLPLPAVPPMMRSKLLLDEAMRYNWELHCNAFRQKALATRMSLADQQEGFEMLWFQFRCEWSQLYSDSLAELRDIPHPEYGEDPETNATLFAEYQQEAHAAFYPVVMMELFQKEVTLLPPTIAIDRLAESSSPSSLRAPESAPAMGGSRAHWAQLYSHSVSELLSARERSTTCGVFLSLPCKGHEGSQSYDDLSSAGGLSENNSFASSAAGPCLSPQQPLLDRSPSDRSPTPRPNSPQPPHHLQILHKMATTESPQCPMDYSTMRFDAELRNSIVAGRRERMREILGAIPAGGAFVLAAAHATSQ